MKSGIKAAALALCLLTSGCSAVDHGALKGAIRSEAVTAASGIQEKWGVEIEGMRLTANGYMLDFRYRIIDADKAVYITDRNKKPMLIDEATGARFVVPAPSKVGNLRQTSNNGKPHEGRTYFMMFANPGMFLKAGSRVTVEIGDFRAENILVQ